MNNEGLQRWAHIAEIVSGVGVLITLIVLLLEVQENTAVTRIAHYQQELAALAEWRNDVISDPIQTRLFTQYQSGQVPEIASEDGVRLRFILLNLWTKYESAYYSRQAGILGDNEWERMNRSICLGYRSFSAFPQYWDRLLLRLTEDFTDYASTYCPAEFD